MKKHNQSIELFVHISGNMELQLLSPEELPFQLRLLAQRLQEALTLELQRNPYDQNNPGQLWPSAKPKSVVPAGYHQAPSRVFDFIY